MRCSLLLITLAVLHLSCTNKDKLTSTFKKRHLISCDLYEGSRCFPNKEKSIEIIFKDYPTDVSVKLSSLNRPIQPRRIISQRNVYSNLMEDLFEVEIICENNKLPPEYQITLYKDSNILQRQIISFEHTSKDTMSGIVFSIDSPPYSINNNPGKLNWKKVYLSGLKNSGEFNKRKNEIKQAWLMLLGNKSGVGLDISKNYITNFDIKIEFNSNNLSEQTINGKSFINLQGNTQTSIIAHEICHSYGLVDVESTYCKYYVDNIMRNNRMGSECSQISSNLTFGSILRMNDFKCDCYICNSKFSVYPANKNCIRVFSQEVSTSSFELSNFPQSILFQFENDLALSIYLEELKSILNIDDLSELSSDLKEDKSALVNHFQKEKERLQRVLNSTEFRNSLFVEISLENYISNNIDGIRHLKARNIAFVLNHNKDSLNNDFVIPDRLINQYFNALGD